MQWPGPLYRCIGRGTLEVWDRPNRGLFEQLRFASDDRQRGKENDCGNRSDGRFQQTSAGHDGYPGPNNLFPSFRIPFTTSRTISKGTSAVISTLPIVRGRTK